MSQVTPGKKRGEARHTKYNPNPKDVGTFSGKPMPVNPPRLSNGMEDPAAFYDSSPLAPDTGKTGHTRRGGVTDTPGTNGSGKRGRMSHIDHGEEEASGGEDELIVDDDFPDDSATPSHKTKTTTSSAHRQRTPSASNAQQPSPSSVSPRTYARKSNLGPSSAGRKTSTIGVGYRPSPGPGASAQRSSPGGSGSGSGARRGGGVSGDDELAEMSMDMDGAMDDSMNLGTDGGGGGGGGDDDDMDEEEETAVHTTTTAGNKGKGKAGKGKGKGKVTGGSNGSAAGKKVRKDPDEDEEEGMGEEEADQNIDENLGGDNQPQDDTEESPVQSKATNSKGKKVTAQVEDDTGANHQEEFDDQGRYDGNDVPEDEDVDIDLEQAAMDAEEGGPGSGGDGAEGEEEEEAVRPKAGKKGKAVKKDKGKGRTEATHIAPGQMGINKRKASGEIARNRKRMSQLNEGEEMEGNGVEGNFVTRTSGRQHIKPLAYWRNEKVEYTSGAKCAEIKCVVFVPEEPVVSFAAKRKNRSKAAAAARARSRSQSARPRNGARRGRGRGGESDDDDQDDGGIRFDDKGRFIPLEAGWDSGTQPLGSVVDFETGLEAERRVAFPARLLHPKVVEGDGYFRYQKVFGEDVYMASGFLELPPNTGFKPEKSSKDNTYSFCVIHGAVDIKVHNTNYILAPGASTMVPRGNKYSITNISPNEAVLFFSQARKIREREGEGSLQQQLSQSQRSQITPARAGESSRNKGGLRSVREEEEDDDEDDDEEGEGGEEEEEEEGSEEEEEAPVVKRVVDKGKKRARVR